jgi:hypothetical protein
MTSSAVGARWVGHPLLALPVPRHLDAFVRFTMWNSITHGFDPLPAGIDVVMMHAVTGFDVPLLTASTDANGTATFHIPLLTPEAPNLYFRVMTGGVSFGAFGHTQAPPPYWSTEGWRSADVGGSTPGLSTDFAGSLFGTPTHPIEFEIGVALFIQLKFESTSEPGTNLKLLPNTKVRMLAGDAPITLEDHTDSDGIVEYFSYDIKPGSSITLKIPMVAEPGGATFPHIGPVFVSYFHQPLAAPIEAVIPPSTSRLASINRTSFGRYGAANPHRVVVPAAGAEMICSAVTALKNLTELNGLIHHAVGAQWTDFANSHINLSFYNTGLSWPLNVINLSDDYAKMRPEQFHEASHQFLWAWGNYTGRGLFADYCAGLIQSLVGPMSANPNVNHSWAWRSNPEQALLEGWATAFQLMAEAHTVELQNSGPSIVLRFDSYRSVISTPPSLIASAAAIPRSQLVANWGESVEGVFGAVLFNLFKEYVLTTPGIGPPPPTTDSLIPPTDDGDITKHPHLAWLKGTSPDDLLAKQRFWNVFVAPALALASNANPTASDFIDQLKIKNSNDWVQFFVPIMKRFHVGGPSMTAWIPASLPPTGGTVTIVGTRFLGGATQVFFGSTAAQITSLAAQGLTCIAPSGTAGAKVDLKLVTTDGEHIIPNAITYS